MWPFKRKQNVTPEEAAELAVRAQSIIQKIHTTNDECVIFEYPERHIWVIAELVLLAWAGAPPTWYFVGRDKGGDRVAFFLTDSGKRLHFQPFRYRWG